MKKALKSFILICLTATALMLSSCIFNDKNTVVDNNTEIINQNWAYVNKIKTDININDTISLYNIYINLRVTTDYKYSNLFLLIHQTGADNNSIKQRKEITLANRDGEWLGQGSGNFYTYQEPFKANYKFTKKGLYHFIIEQNMRDNPLREVSDVGLRIEKVQ